jgi:hypothetical protein
MDATHAVLGINAHHSFGSRLVQLATTAEECGSGLDFFLFWLFFKKN